MLGLHPSLQEGEAQEGGGCVQLHTEEAAKFNSVVPMPLFPPTSLTSSRATATWCVLQNLLVPRKPWEPLTYTTGSAVRMGTPTPN